MRAVKRLVRNGRREHAAHEPLISSVIVAEVPLAGLFFRTGKKSQIEGEDHHGRGGRGGQY